MVFRKKRYIITGLLLILLASVMLVFIMFHNSSNEHKGTLVREQTEYVQTEADETGIKETGTDALASQKTDGSYYEGRKK